LRRMSEIFVSLQFIRYVTLMMDSLLSSGSMILFSNSCWIFICTILDSGSNYRMVSYRSRKVLFMVWYRPFTHRRGRPNTIDMDTNGLQKLANPRKLEGACSSQVEHPMAASYETLMTLQGSYTKQIYEALGIESDHIPMFRDGNSKYERSKATCINENLYL